MHEMSLAQNIVEIVEGVSQQNNNRDVAKIKLIVGELAGVELQSLMQSLTIAAHGTVMEGAEIELERPEGTAWCMKCAQTVPFHHLGYPCPICGGYQLKINGGNEFRVSELELKTED